MPVPREGKYVPPKAPAYLPARPTVVPTRVLPAAGTRQYAPPLPTVPQVGIPGQYAPGLAMTPGGRVVPSVGGPSALPFGSMQATDQGVYLPPADGGQQAALPGGNQPFGPFATFDQWQVQFQAEHGRLPNEQDMYDAVDSFNFLAQTGRAPTEAEWRNRYYTGAWSSGYGGGGYGGGGGGYGGYTPTAQQASQFMWNPGLYFWNIR